MRLLAGTILTCLTLAIANPCSAAPIKGWILKQNTDYRGSQTVYLVPGIGKIMSKDLGLIARSNAKVTIFNQQRKTYLELTHKEFMDKFGALVDPKKIRVTAGAKSKMCGQQAQQYLIELVSRRGRVYYKEELWATRSLPMSQQFIDECATIFEIPSTFGVPLKLVRDYRDGRHIVMIDTLECKPASFAKSDFELAKGFTAVKSEADVLVSADSGDLSELMDMRPPNSRSPTKSGGPTARP
jgi:hypothetical protein